MMRDQIEEVSGGMESEGAFTDRLDLAVSERKESRMLMHFGLKT